MTARTPDTSPSTPASIGSQIAAAILDGCDDLAVQPCHACRHAATIARCFTPADDATVDEAATIPPPSKRHLGHIRHLRELLHKPSGEMTDADWAVIVGHPLRSVPVKHLDAVLDFFDAADIAIGWAAAASGPHPCEPPGGFGGVLQTPPLTFATVPTSPSAQDFARADRLATTEDCDHEFMECADCTICGTVLDSTYECTLPPGHLAKHYASPPSVAGGADDGGLRAAIEALAAEMPTVKPGSYPAEVGYWRGYYGDQLRAILAAHPAVDRG